jgi:hypothetical protein
MRRRSYWEKAETTVAISSPEAVVVSTLTSRTTMRHPPRPARAIRAASVLLILVAAALMRAQLTG